MFCISRVWHSIDMFLSAIVKLAFLIFWYSFAFEIQNKNFQTIDSKVKFCGTLIWNLFKWKNSIIDFFLLISFTKQLHHRCLTKHQLMARSLVIYDLRLETKSVYEAGWSGREELNRYPPPSPAVLWIVNARERKPR